MARKPTLHPKREPSGRLSRSTAEAIDAVTPATAKRMRDDAAAGYGDPRWGSELGRLSLHGQLTAVQYEAGRRWGRLVSEWYRATGSPSPYPPALGGGHTHVGDDPGVTTAAGKALREARLNIMADMMEALKALDEAGPDAAQAVRACCEANEVHVGHVGLLNLRAGLDRLAKHWRLSR